MILLLYLYIALVVIGAIVKRLFRSAFRIASVAFPIYLIYCLITGKPVFERD